MWAGGGGYYSDEDSYNYGYGGHRNKPKPSRAKPPTSWYTKLTDAQLTSLLEAAKLPTTIEGGEDDPEGMLLDETETYIERLEEADSTAIYTFEGRAGRSVESRVRFENGGDYSTYIPPVDGFTVSQLKAECKAQGLVQSGKRFDVVLRLLQAAHGTGSPKRAAVEIDPETGETVLKKRKKSTKPADLSKLSARIVKALNVDKSKWSNYKHKMHLDSVFQKAVGLIQKEAEEKGFIKDGDPFAAKVCEAVFTPIIESKKSFGWNYIEHNYGRAATEVAAIMTAVKGKMTKEDVDHHLGWVTRMSRRALNSCQEGWEKAPRLALDPNVQVPSPCDVRFDGSCRKHGWGNPAKDSTSVRDDGTRYFGGRAGCVLPIAREAEIKAKRVVALAWEKKDKLRAAAAEAAVPAFMGTADFANRSEWIKVEKSPADQSEGAAAVAAVNAAINAVPKDFFGSPIGDEIYDLYEQLGETQRGADMPYFWRHKTSGKKHVSTPVAVDILCKTFQSGQLEAARAAANESAFYGVARVDKEKDDEIDAATAAKTTDSEDEERRQRTVYPRFTREELLEQEVELYGKKANLSPNAADGTASETAATAAANPPESFGKSIEGIPKKTDLLISDSSTSDVTATAAGAQDNAAAAAAPIAYAPNLGNELGNEVTFTCNNFNTGTCISNKACQFQHKCSKCGGDHAAKDCTEFISNVDKEVAKGTVSATIGVTPPESTDSGGSASDDSKASNRDGSDRVVHPQRQQQQHVSPLTQPAHDGEPGANSMLRLPGAALAPVAMLPPVSLATPSATAPAPTVNPGDESELDAFGAAASAVFPGGAAIDAHKVSTSTAVDNMDSITGTKRASTRFEPKVARRQSKRIKWREEDADSENDDVEIIEHDGSTITSADGGKEQELHQLTSNQAEQIKRQKQTYTNRPIRIYPRRNADLINGPGQLERDCPFCNFSKQFYDCGECNRISCASRGCDQTYKYCARCLKPFLTENLKAACKEAREYLDNSAKPSDYEALSRMARILAHQDNQQYKRLETIETWVKQGKLHLRCSRKEVGASTPPRTRANSKVPDTVQGGRAKDPIVID